MVYRPLRPSDEFGYKDLISFLTANRYNLDQWVDRLVSAGAKYVIPVAEHHDGFAMHNNDLTPWCAGRMGTKRDLMGDLAVVARKRKFIFGCSSYRMEHGSFACPPPGIPKDEFDPRHADFYSPPIPGKFNNSNASPAFQTDWLARVQELVDNYQSQLLYFDNGVNTHTHDDVKLRAASCSYNRAAQWGREAPLATKGVACFFGSVQDFEKQLRAPRWIYPAAGWQCDDALGSIWGETTDMTVRARESVIHERFETASQGGNLLLNISSMGDGSIPEVQQPALLAIGARLKVKGESIYGSRLWVRMGEGPLIPHEAPGDWKGSSTAVAGPRILRPKLPPPGDAHFRFPVANQFVFAFGCRWPSQQSRLLSFASGSAMIEHVSLLGSTAPLSFHQTDEALLVTLPPGELSSQLPHVLRLERHMPLGLVSN